MSLRPSVSRRMTFGLGAIGRGRLPIAVFAECFGTACRVRRCFSARLNEIGRVGDHRGYVALIGATEVLIGPIFEIRFVLDRGPEIFRPQSAWTRIGHDACITHTNRRELAWIVRVIRRSPAAPRWDAGCGQHVLDVANRYACGLR